MRQQYSETARFLLEDRPSAVVDQDSSVIITLTVSLDASQYNLHNVTLRSELKAKVDAVSKDLLSMLQYAKKPQRTHHPRPSRDSTDYAPFILSRWVNREDKKQVIVTDRYQHTITGQSWVLARTTRHPSPLDEVSYSYPLSEWRQHFMPERRDDKTRPEKFPEIGSLWYQPNGLQAYVARIDRGKDGTMIALTNHDRWDVASFFKYWSPDRRRKE